MLGALSTMISMDNRERVSSPPNGRRKVSVDSHNSHSGSIGSRHAKTIAAIETTFTVH